MQDYVSVSLSGSDFKRAHKKIEEILRWRKDELKSSDEDSGGYWKELVDSAWGILVGMAYVKWKGNLPSIVKFNIPQDSYDRDWVDWETGGFPW